MKLRGHFRCFLLLLLFLITSCNSTRIGRCVFGKLILGDQQQSSIRGVVTFVEEKDNITKAQYRISGLAEGPHALRVHEYGDIWVGDGPQNTNDLFNPNGVNISNHCPTFKYTQTGDMGNITADASGLAEGEIILNGLTLQGTLSLIGRTLTLHFNPSSCPYEDILDNFTQCIIGVANIPDNEAHYLPTDKDRLAISCVLSSHEDHNLAGIFVLKKKYQNTEITSFRMKGIGIHNPSINIGLLNHGDLLSDKPTSADIAHDMGTRETEYPKGTFVYEVLFPMSEVSLRGNHSIIGKSLAVMNAIEPFVILGGCVIGATAPKPVSDAKPVAPKATNKPVDEQEQEMPENPWEIVVEFPEVNVPLPQSISTPPPKKVSQTVTPFPTTKEGIMSVIAELKAERDAGRISVSEYSKRLAPYLDAIVTATDSTNPQSPPAPKAKPSSVEVSTTKDIVQDTSNPTTSTLKPSQTTTNQPKSTLKPKDASPATKKPTTQKVEQHETSVTSTVKSKKSTQSKHNTQNSTQHSAPKSTLKTSDVSAQVKSTEPLLSKNLETESQNVEHTPVATPTEVKQYEQEATQIQEVIETQEPIEQTQSPSMQQTQTPSIEVKSHVEETLVIETPAAQSKEPVETEFIETQELVEATKSLEIQVSVETRELKDEQPVETQISVETQETQEPTQEPQSVEVQSPTEVQTPSQQSQEPQSTELEIPTQPSQEPEDFVGVQETQPIQTQELEPSLDVQDVEPQPAIQETQEHTQQPQFTELENTTQQSQEPQSTELKTPSQQSQEAIDFVEAQLVPTQEPQIIETSLAVQDVETQQVVEEIQDPTQESQSVEVQSPTQELEEYTQEEPYVEMLRPVLPKLFDSEARETPNEDVATENGAAEEPTQTDEEFAEPSFDGEYEVHSQEKQKSIPANVLKAIRDELKEENLLKDGAQKESSSTSSALVVVALISVSVFLYKRYSQKEGRVRREYIKDHDWYEKNV